MVVESWIPSLLITSKLRFSVLIKILVTELRCVCIFLYLCMCSIWVGSFFFLLFFWWWWWWCTPECYGFDLKRLLKGPCVKIGSLLMALLGGGAFGRWDLQGNFKSVGACLQREFWDPRLFLPPSDCEVSGPSSLSYAPTMLDCATTGPEQWDQSVMDFNLQNWSKRNFSSL